MVYPAFMLIFGTLKFPSILMPELCSGGFKPILSLKPPTNNQSLLKNKSKSQFEGVFLIQTYIYI